MTSSLAAALLCLVAVASAQTTCTWVTAGAGFWEVATNWDNGVPDTVSTAVIALPTAQVTIRSNVSVAHLNLTAGSLSLSRNFTLAVGGNLTMSGTSAMLELQGFTQVSTLLLVGTNNTVWIEGGSGGSLAVATSFVLSGSNNALASFTGGSVSLAQTCNTNIFGGDENGFTIQQVDLVNLGSISFLLSPSSFLYLANGTVITNNGTFSVLAQPGSVTIAGDLASSFVNNQVLSLASGLALNTSFTNQGSVNVSAETLNLEVGGEHTGTFFVDVFGTITVQSEDVFYNSVDGNGNVRVYGEATFFHSIFSPNLRIYPGAKATFESAAGTVNNTNEIWVEGTLESNAWLNVASLAAMGSAEGCGISTPGFASISVNSFVIWTETACNFTGTLNLMPNATCDLTDADGFFGNFVFNNYGIITLPGINGNSTFYFGSVALYNYGTFLFEPSDGDSIVIDSGSSFVNEVGGMLSLPLGNFSASITGAGTMQNFGWIDVNGSGEFSTSLTLSAGNFANCGNVTVENVTLLLASDGTHNGSFSTNSLGMLRFSAGQQVLLSPASIPVGSHVDFGGASVNVSTSGLLAAFKQAGGAVTFTLPYNTTASIQLLGGKLAFLMPTTLRSVLLESGTLAVSKVTVTTSLAVDSSEVTIVGAQGQRGQLTLFGTSEFLTSEDYTSPTLSNVTVTNYGSMNVEAGDQAVECTPLADISASIVNTASASLSVSTSVCRSSAVLTNNGTLTVQSPENSTLTLALSLTNFGILNLQGDGTVEISGPTTFLYGVTRTENGTRVLMDTADFFEGSDSAFDIFIVLPKASVTLSSTQFKASWVTVHGILFCTVACSFPAAFVVERASLMVLEQATIGQLSVSGNVQMEPKGTLTVTDTFAWYGGTELSSTLLYGTINLYGASVLVGALGGPASLMGSDVRIYDSGSLSDTISLVSNASLTIFGKLSVDSGDAYIRASAETSPKSYFANYGSLDVASSANLHICAPFTEGSNGTKTVGGCLDTTCDGTMCGSSSSPSKAPEWHIIVIVVSVVGGVVLIAVVVGVFLWRRKKNRRGSYAPIATEKTPLL